MISVEEARAKAFANATPLPSERVKVFEALGRVLAEDAKSDIDVAPFDNTSMDGYALRFEDIAGASEESPVVLSVIDHIAAGSVSPLTVTPGTAARIMTGAPIPEGANAVVKLEETEALEQDGGKGGTVAIKVAAVLGDNIRFRGEEVQAGAVVLSAGEIVTPAAIGLLASTGNEAVSVYRRPRVAILSTGDELVTVAEQPGPGKIRDCNSYSLAAQTIAAGGVPLLLGIVRDNEEATRAAFTNAAKDADFIISSGGVSVGDFDFVKRVLADLGVMSFHKVNMRPGAPQTYGTINGIPFFGLPGNPTSAYVGFEMFVRPMLRLMQGFREIERPIVQAVLTEPTSKHHGRRTYLRARLERVSDPCAPVRYNVSLTGNQSSALLSAMYRASCLLILPESEYEFPAGTVMNCLRLDIDEGVV
ncbi:MAG: gephyrin-like molybdotransferase Glp [Coriobacteriia bacterium]